MSLFTIIDSSRKIRYLVSADKINEIIEKTCEKMKLPSHQYKLVLEENGAVMDEDAFLLSLPVLTNIMILKMEEEWVSKEESLKRNETFSRTSRDEQSVIRTEVLNVSAVREKRSPFSFPWSAIPGSIIEKLDKQETLSYKDGRSLRKIIGTHMDGNLKDYRRSTANLLTNLLADKYPEALKVVDADGEKINDGREVFLIKLYDHVNSIKPDNEKSKRKRRATSSIEENDNHADLGNICHDEYGCVAYQMPLPPDETKLTQEEKRLELLEKRILWKNQNEEESLKNEIGNLMDKTYSTQRIDIRYRESFSQVLVKWPCLQDEPFFLKHASTLIGKNQGDIWILEVQSKGPALFSFFEGEIMKNTQICEKRQEARKQMKNIIDEARMASRSLHCETPKIIALFRLLPQYFLEKETEVFHILLDTSSPETVKSFGETERPVFIIKGKSFFDEEAKGEIFVEGEKIVDAKNVLQGFLYLILSYYIYGYTYGTESKLTMEFIQRVFQKINPEKGHKRGKKAKRNHHTTNPRVQKLMSSIGVIISE